MARVSTDLPDVVRLEEGEEVVQAALARAYAEQDGPRFAGASPALDDDFARVDAAPCQAWRWLGQVRHRAPVLVASVVGALAFAVLLSARPVVTVQMVPLENRVYDVDHTLWLDDLMVMFHRFSEMSDRSRLHLFTVNAAERALPGGVSVDDGEGHEAEIIPATEKVPPRSAQRRAVDVSREFNGLSRQMRLRQTTRTRTLK